jgi:hypothetical protein
MPVATGTTKHENGWVPVGEEFVCHWWHEPDSQSDTGGLQAPPIVAPLKAGAREAISLSGMPHPPRIGYDGGDKAYYRPLTDGIHLPKRDSFESTGEYYS